MSSHFKHCISQYHTTSISVTIFLDCIPIVTQTLLDTGSCFQFKGNITRNPAMLYLHHGRWQIPAAPKLSWGSSTGTGCSIRLPCWFSAPESMNQQYRNRMAKSLWYLQRLSEAILSRIALHQLNLWLTYYRRCNFMKT